MNSEFICKFNVVSIFSIVLFLKCTSMVLSKYLSKGYLHKGDANGKRIFYNEVEYLGHEVGTQWIKVDPDKVCVMRKMTATGTVKQVCILEYTTTVRKTQKFNS